MCSSQVGIGRALYPGGGGGPDEVLLSGRNSFVFCFLWLMTPLSKRFCCIHPSTCSNLRWVFTSRLPLYDLRFHCWLPDTVTLGTQTLFQWETVQSFFNLGPGSYFGNAVQNFLFSMYLFLLGTFCQWLHPNFFLCVILKSNTFFHFPVSANLSRSLM